MLLTYAQCDDLDPFELTIILDRWELSASLEERITLTGIHLHAFAMWERQFETRNVRLFDVDGCHPNIAVIKRTPEAAFDYAIKDGDVVAGGDYNGRGPR